jgi:thymidine kinase
MGRLSIILGCMFAQKTTELLRRIRQYKAIGYSVLVVNYAGDTRYGTDKIISHNTDSYDALCVSSLKHVSSLVESGIYQVVIIDEVQFFKDLYEHVVCWADTLPIHIVVAGLSGDSKREPFGDILRLIPHAEEILHLTALCSICKNGTLAHFSKCMKADKVEQVVIGGADTYMPVCRTHYTS